MVKDEKKRWKSRHVHTGDELVHGGMVIQDGKSGVFEGFGELLAGAGRNEVNDRHAKPFDHIVSVVHRDRPEVLTQLNQLATCNVKTFVHAEACGACRSFVCSSFVLLTGHRGYDGEGHPFGVVLP